MRKNSIEQIRNIALVGQAGCGKTSLLEAILHRANRSYEKGSIESGTTLSDYTDDERDCMHSLYTAFASIDSSGTKMNFIDTPGHPDFVAQALMSMSSAETVALVISADGHIDSYSRSIMEQAKVLQRCRMIIVNRIDHDGADCKRIMQEIRAAFGKECLPVNLPANRGTAVQDVFFHPDGESDLGTIADAHRAIYEQVIEVDESLTEEYLEHGESIDRDRLHDAFERALREDHVIPICFTSARCTHDKDSDIGISELLDFCTRLLPSPLEGNCHNFTKNGELLCVSPDRSLHTIAHVFMVRNDPYLGNLSFCRIHQGVINQTSQLFLGTYESGESKKPVRIGHIQVPHGKETREIEEAGPGDIVVLYRIPEVHRDAVLHSHHEEDNIHFVSLKYPTPIYGRAIGVRNSKDEHKFVENLHKIIDDDPTLRLERDPVTQETILYGLGEQHLRNTLERLVTRGELDLEIHPPRISYRETITASAQGHCRHKKQTGGAGQFAEVYLRIEPLPRGSGYVFDDEVVGGVIPRQFIPAVEKGVRAAMEQGTLAGYPVQDVRVVVYDGKDHPVDSKEIAFHAAGKKAFQDAYEKAHPKLLEPVMKVLIEGPSSYLGEIAGHLTQHRGRIIDTTIGATGNCLTQAAVPLTALQNYQSELKGLTGGEATYRMEFSHYDFVPEALSRGIAEGAKERIASFA